MGIVCVCVYVCVCTCLHMFHMTHIIYVTYINVIYHLEVPRDTHRTGAVKVYHYYRHYDTTATRAMQWRGKFHVGKH